MSVDVKKTAKEREIIRRLDAEIAEMRKKTHQFEEENPHVRLDSGVTDLSAKIHSGILPKFKKPTIH
ncbi:MAG: hypothetical protein HQL71_02240 [Magnetococcales bacterium]|nr:hypothetical protein [Magnetococcales bacterium]